MPIFIKIDILLSTFSTINSHKYEKYETHSYLLRHPPGKYSPGDAGESRHPENDPAHAKATVKNIDSFVLEACSRYPI